MSWFRKSVTFVAILAIGASVMAAKKEEKPKEDAKPARAKENAKKKGKESDAKEGEEKSKMSVPLPVGHDAKGLTIPYRDRDGKLQMRFVMELGRRIDPDHLAMKKLLIETFDDAEAKEMSIDLPESLLDLNTRVISTKNGVTIQRDDFELTGQTMEFNTETKQGRLGGKVRMKIYNLANEANPEPEATTPREP